MWAVEYDRSPQSFETVREALEDAFGHYLIAGDEMHIEGFVGTVVRGGREVITASAYELSDRPGYDWRDVAG